MKQPSTSKEANDLKTNESKRKDYDRIILALKNIHEGHYEDISKAIGISELSVVSRRMKEMRQMGLIENTGIKKLTSRNRNAFVHKISEGEPKQKEKKAKREKKTISTDQKFIEVSAYKRRIKKENIKPNQNYLF